MLTFDKRNARLWSIMGINPAIWSVAFSEVGEERDDTVVLTADLERYSGLQRTFQKWPERCFNVGIAEQNMVGIGAGLAMEGKQVWMTTYAPFMTFRCADHVRHLMGNLKLNMKAIGSAAGFSAGFSGASLLAVNDIALTRSIPNMVVLSPADTMEAVKMVIAMSKTDAPCYMRFCGTVNLPIVYTEDYEFEIGKGVELVSGEGIAIIATGTTIVSEALKTGKMIAAKEGFQPTIIDMHTIKPLDTQLIERLMERHDTIITLEEHSIIGGLGSAIAEFVTKKGWGGSLKMMGIEDKNYEMGTRNFMLDQAGLKAEKIVNRYYSEL